MYTFTACPPRILLMLSIVLGIILPSSPPLPQAIIRGRAMDAAVVVKAAVSILRLTRRLLPYRPDFAEPLLRALQLVPGLAPEAAWDNAQARTAALCRAPA